MTVTVVENVITPTVHQRRGFPERKLRISSLNKKRMIASGGRSMSEKTLGTAAVGVAIDLAIEETSTTGRGTGQSPLQGGEIVTGLPRAEGGGTERDQALARGGGGRGPAHTGETDQCPPVIGGRDTDNIMLYSFVNTSHV